VTGRVLLFVVGVAWGVQFIVFRKWWTALFLRNADQIRPFRPLPDGFWRNLYLLAAAVSFIWAGAMLTGFPS